MFSSQYGFNLKNLDDVDIYKLIKRLLIEEKFGYGDKTARLEKLKEECDSRNKEDLYQTAVEDAEDETINLHNMRFASGGESVSKLSNISSYKLLELLEQSFKDKEESIEPDKYSSVFDIMDSFELGPDSFICTVSGDSMVNAKIYKGDSLIADPSAKPEDGKLAIVSIDGEIFVKRLKFRDDDIWLVSENENYPKVKVCDNFNFKILGIVKTIVKKAE